MLDRESYDGSENALLSVVTEFLRDEHEEVKEVQAVPSEKMRVLPGTEKEIRRKRAVFLPAKNETIMRRGTNA
jgi:hypothetical protein